MRAAALLFGLALPLTAAAEETAIVDIGVRREARPFAWYDEENRSPNGFLVDLCLDAVTNAGYAYRIRPVSARERAGFLDGSADLGIDLLCDPTTMTMARTRRFLEMAEAGQPPLGFSPIVFLANGTYFTKAAIGALPGHPAPGDGTACHLIRQGTGAAEGDETPAPVYLTAGFVVGTTGQEEIALTAAIDIAQDRAEAAGDQYLCPMEFETHRDGVAAFCEPAGGLDFYFADADILDAYMALWEAETGKRCPRLPPRIRQISYEPYALVISGRTPGFRDRFLKGLYEIFHRENLVAGRFATHFPGRRMSGYLETLFRIYAIP